MSDLTDRLLVLAEHLPEQRSSFREAAAEISRLNGSLDISIKSWHETETKLSILENVLMEILRMPAASAHAKAAARKALREI